MIEMDLMVAAMKPSDLKVCSKCKNLNWYSNEGCINMSCDCNSFIEEEATVRGRVQEDYTFYMEEEGMTEKEVDYILIEV